MIEPDEVDDARSCVARLEKFDAHFNELQALYRGKTLFNEQRAFAQQKLRDLKEALESEHKRLRSLEREDRLNRFEDAFYLPAIRETLAEISPLRWNSTPNNEWHSTIYGAHINIKHHLFGLRRLTGQPNEIG